MELEGLAPAGALVVVAAGAVVVAAGAVVVAAGAVVVAAGAVVVVAARAVVVVAAGTVVVASVPATAEVVTADSGHEVVVAAEPAHRAVVVADVLSVTALLVWVFDVGEVGRGCAETSEAKGAPKVTKMTVARSATAITGGISRRVRSNVVRLAKEANHLFLYCTSA